MTPDDYAAARACQLFLDRLAMGDPNIAAVARAARDELGKLIDCHARLD